MSQLVAFACEGEGGWLYLMEFCVGACLPYWLLFVVEVLCLTTHWRAVFSFEFGDAEKKQGDHRLDRSMHKC